MEAYKALYVWGKTKQEHHHNLVLTVLATVAASWFYTLHILVPTSVLPKVQCGESQPVITAVNAEFVLRKANTFWCLVLLGNPTADIYFTDHLFSCIAMLGQSSSELAA